MVVGVEEKNLKAIIKNIFYYSEYISTITLRLKFGYFP